MMTIYQLVHFECDRCHDSVEVKYPKKYLGCFMAPQGWIARHKDGIGLVHFCPKCAKTEEENGKKTKKD